MEFWQLQKHHKVANEDSKHMRVGERIYIVAKQMAKIVKLDERGSRKRRNEKGGGERKPNEIGKKKNVTNWSSFLV